jgi:hypothetical protein
MESKKTISVPLVWTIFPCLIWTLFWVNYPSLSQIFPILLWKISFIIYLFFVYFLYKDFYLNIFINNSLITAFAILLLGIVLSRYSFISLPLAGDELYHAQQASPILNFIYRSIDWLNTSSLPSNYSFKLFNTLINSPEKLSFIISGILVCLVCAASFFVRKFNNYKITFFTFCFGFAFLAFT